MCTYSSFILDIKPFLKREELVKKLSDETLSIKEGINLLNALSKFPLPPYSLLLTIEEVEAVKQNKGYVQVNGGSGGHYYYFRTKN